MTMLANKSYVVIYYHKKNKKNVLQFWALSNKKGKRALSSLTFDASRPLVNTGTTTAVPVRPLLHDMVGAMAEYAAVAAGRVEMPSWTTDQPRHQRCKLLVGWGDFFPSAAPGESRGELPRTAGERCGNLPDATGCSLVIVRTGVDDAQETDR
jgi:hypothetical protein